MSERSEQLDKDLALLVFAAYKRASGRGEFVEILEGYQFLSDEKLSLGALFALCNAAHHAGYIEGLEENE